MTPSGLYVTVLEKKQGNSGMNSSPWTNWWKARFHNLLSIEWAQTLFTKWSEHREEVYIPKWDDYFMFMALLTAQRSKDPSTQVGACIVNKNNHIVAAGYNGFPKGVSNYAFAWDREGDDPLYTKYMYVSHAEENAIDNRGSRLAEGGRIYVSLHPCNKCAGRIIQNGIKEVIYLSDKYHDKPEATAARWMFREAGVNTRQLVSDRQITLTLGQ